jgi:hypothetical protein
LGEPHASYDGQQIVGSTSAPWPAAGRRQHQDVEQFGAGSRTEDVERLPPAAQRERVKRVLRDLKQATVRVPSRSAADWHQTRLDVAYAVGQRTRCASADS